MITLHANYTLIADTVDDPETLVLCKDLLAVTTAVHQGGSIIGPWMETRVKSIVRCWLPGGWLVSGPSQVFRQDRPGVRSRSWDVIVHRSPNMDLRLPPPASLEGGYPLLPIETVAALIDTKTNFSDPKRYAEETMFNLLNDATERQVDFLGTQIPKIVLAASSSRSPDSMYDTGLACGLMAFSLGRYTASPVPDAENRITTWRLERFKDGRYPLQAFKLALLEAVDKWPSVP